MYALYASKREPLGLWQLDDTPPYQDYSGYSRVGDTVAGSTASTNSYPLVAGATRSAVFDNTHRARFASPVFNQGQENQNFNLEAWIRPIGTPGPQKVLSHSGVYDGLIINGTQVSFVIKYATAEDAVCTYDLTMSKGAHVVAMYSHHMINLLVDGVGVDSWEMTEAQMQDQFVTTDGYLYTGESTSAQKVQVNGIGLYGQPSPLIYQQNFQAGRRSIPQVNIAPRHNGTILNMNGGDSDLYINTVFNDRETFNLGVINNVAIDDDKVSPVYDNVTGISQSGAWTCGISLDLQGDTSVYGVTVTWSGVGVTVEGSINGTTWTELEQGKLIPMFTPGSDPTGVDLEVRVIFDGGSTNDYSYLESLRITALRDVTITSTALRSITAAAPVVPMSDSEPIVQQFDNGVRLNGGTITIGADSSTVPQTTRTLELWVKNDGGQPSSSLTGTVYKNGAVAAGGIDVDSDQWALLHIVSASGTSSSITLTGNVTIGQVTLYEDALTASQIADINKAYSGYPKIRIEDTSSINASPAAIEAAVYGHTWAIKQG